MSQSSPTQRSTVGGNSPQSAAREVQSRQECEMGECEDFQALVDEVTTSVTRYCRQRPTAAALSIFALGFFVGWKIKPW